MDSDYPRNGSRKDRLRLSADFPYLIYCRPGTDGFHSSAPHRLSRVRCILPCRRGFIANCATPISDLYALEAIRLIYKYLPVAVADGKNLKARAKIAWASTLAGMVEATSSCTSEHSLEHAMSAYYPQLPHGAGLIALSEAYFETFRHDCTKRYMKMAEMMTQKRATVRPISLMH